MARPKTTRARLETRLPKVTNTTTRDVLYLWKFPFALQEYQQEITNHKNTPLLSPIFYLLYMIYETIKGKRRDIYFL